MNQGYAIATVVGRAAPVSSHLGDRATIYADGRMEGFIGGSCSRDIVRRQALSAIRAGEPRLVRIRPEALEAEQSRDVVTVPMACVSEGAVDVYIEPQLPKRQLLVAGFTPVAHAVAHIAPLLEYEVVRFIDDRETADEDGRPIASLERYLASMDAGVRERSAALAASQGHYDEAALAAFLRYDLAYVGLLASPKRAAAILGMLERGGVPASRLAAVHHPAGLDIGARRPAEVAISIFAEIVAGKAETAPLEPSAASGSATARDPVCGMDVEIADAAFEIVFEGRTYYFCCPHCRTAFTADPARYLQAGAPS
jgi:xanthine dehydrogenase accessory factor